MEVAPSTIRSQLESVGLEVGLLSMFPVVNKADFSVPLIPRSGLQKYRQSSNLWRI